MTLADLTVDIVAIIGAIAGKRRNPARNLLQQGPDLRAVIDVLAGQLGGNDLSCVGVHPDMELSPGPTHLCGVLLDQPLTGTTELEPRAVHQQVNRFAAWSWSRHRQCLAPSADRRMVGCCEIKTKQPKQGCDQPFGLAQRQAENRPQRQRRGYRPRRVARLTAARAAWLAVRLPPREKSVRNGLAAGGKEIRTLGPSRGQNAVGAHLPDQNLAAGLRHRTQPVLRLRKQFSVKSLIPGVRCQRCSKASTVAEAMRVASGIASSGPSPNRSRATRAKSLQVLSPSSALSFSVAAIQAQRSPQNDRLGGSSWAETAPPFARP